MVEFEILKFVDIEELEKQDKIKLVTVITGERMENLEYHTYIVCGKVSEFMIWLNSDDVVYRLVSQLKLTTEEAFSFTKFKYMVSDNVLEQKDKYAKGVMLYTDYGTLIQLPTIILSNSNERIIHIPEFDEDYLYYINISKSVTIIDGIEKPMDELVDIVDYFSISINMVDGVVILTRNAHYYDGDITCSIVINKVSKRAARM